MRNYVGERQFISLDERLDAALTADPALAADVEDKVARMGEADRRYAASLAELRHAAEQTQIELGTKMGLPQSKVSRLENGGDMLLSTFTRYLAAVGEHPRVVVTINGDDVELDLASAAR